MRARLFFALVMAACAPGAGTPAANEPTPVRFRNADPIWVVDDRADTPRLPARRFVRNLYLVDTLVTDRLDRAVSDPGPTPAANVNAWDEVPDSSWFENRVGRRPLSPEDLRQGPKPTLPFEVLGTKVGGLSPGLLVRDARGVKYIMKFDGPGKPEAETAADVIAQRLFWAVGYHTPRDAVMRTDPSTWTLAPGAEVKNLFGERRPMTARDLEDVIRRLDRAPDGTIRVLLSELLDGVPLGGYAQQGVREGDPNDRVPHELRREQRGAYVFFSWLNHVDIKDDNTLDMWVPHPERPGARYVKHHLVDFGSTLGVMALGSGRSVGFTHLFDPQDGVRALASFGIRTRAWETVRPVPLRGIGLLESDVFDPATWRPRLPWRPFQVVDERDGFWGAKILARLDERLIETAVDEGQLSDPQARAYLLRTLIARQRKVLRHWFGQSNPVDGFAIENRGRDVSVCFEDLWLRHVDRSTAADTTYDVTAADVKGRRLGHHRLAAAGPQTCAVVPTGPTSDGYTIVTVRTLRPSTPAAARPVEIHIARRPTDGQPRVIGIVR